MSYNKPFPCERIQQASQGGVPETPKRPPGKPAAVAPPRSGKGVRFKYKARRTSMCAAC